MTSPSKQPRLTRVQRDVLDRMRDGWELRRGLEFRFNSLAYSWQLQKPGEPSRHVATVTIDALRRRGYLDVLIAGLAAS